METIRNGDNISHHRRFRKGALKARTAQEAGMSRQTVYNMLTTLPKAKPAEILTIYDIDPSEKKPENTPVKARGWDDYEPKEQLSPEEFSQLLIGGGRR
jgi:hypothetical protein